MAKQTEAPPVGTQLMDLIGKATADDVAALDAQIAEKERELDSLRTVRRVLALATGLETKKKPGGGPRKKADGQPRPAGGGSMAEERRTKCARYIAKHGVTTGARLCDLFEIPTGSQTGVLDHPWFLKTNAGYDLTPAGRAAVATAA